MGIVKFASTHGDVFIEVDDDTLPSISDDLTSKGFVAKSAKGGAQTVTEAAENLGAAMGSVKGYLETIQDLVADLSFVPKEVSMEIGLKITAAAGVVIASAGTEGTLKIVLKWEPGARKAAS